MEAGGQMFKWSGYRGYWEPRPPRQPSSFFTWDFFKSQRLLRCETCELDVQILMSFENLIMEEFSSGYAWKLRNYWEPRPPGARTTTEHFHLNPKTFWDIFSNLVQEGIFKYRGYWEPRPLRQPPSSVLAKIHPYQHPYIIIQGGFF